MSRGAAIARVVDGAAIEAIEGVAVASAVAIGVIGETEGIGEIAIAVPGSQENRVPRPIPPRLRWHPPPLSIRRAPGTAAWVRWAISCSA